MTRQNAMVWEGGDIVAVRPVPVPESRPGWVAVDVAYAGICGSDLHIAAGEHSRAQPGIVLGHDSSATSPNRTETCRMVIQSSSAPWSTAASAKPAWRVVPMCAGG